MFKSFRRFILFNSHNNLVSKYCIYFGEIALITHFTEVEPVSLRSPGPRFHLVRGKAGVQNPGLFSRASPLTAGHRAKF